MNKYAAVIFDLDGVICHTDKYHYLAWKALADRLGIEFNETINDRLRGVSRAESLEIILEKYDGFLTAEEKANFAAEKNDLYRAMLQNMSTSDLSAEVRQTLELLRQKGFLLAIGSSSKNTPLILQQIGLGGFFDKISDGNNITRSKPDPEVFLKAAEYLGVEPGRCLVVEDAAAGVDAALAGGMDVAAIGSAVEYGKATYNLDQFADLLKVVGD